MVDAFGKDMPGTGCKIAEYAKILISTDWSWVQLDGFIRDGENEKGLGTRGRRGMSTKKNP